MLIPWRAAAPRSAPNKDSGIRTLITPSPLTSGTFSPMSLSDLFSKPFSALLKTLPQLRWRLLTSERSPNSLQLLFERQFASRHLFLSLLLSRSFGRNFRGGVTACPNNPQGLQRNIRTPAYDTLSPNGPPQNPHRPATNGFLERIALSFTVAVHIRESTSSTGDSWSPNRRSKLAEIGFHGGRFRKRCEFACNRLI